MIVSPGEFYGPAGSAHIRVAAVAPMDRLDLVASRLGVE
jgi:aspartate/methionine/tyrosine aminotransferase